MTIDIDAIRQQVERYTGFAGSSQSFLAHQLAKQVPALIREAEQHRANANLLYGQLTQSRAKVDELTAEMERARADERDAIVADIENMPINLGDTGWKHIERKAVEAGYPAEIVRRRRTRDDFTTDTIEAAYQYGYRTAARVARGEATP